MAKRVAILGSTGSIGLNALSVMEHLGEEFEVFALTAHSKIEELAEQVRKYQPKVAAVTDTVGADQLRKMLRPCTTEILSGPESMAAIAEMAEVDILLTAVVGAAGLEAALAGAKQGKRLAIANKEPLVIAGELLTRTARESGAEILPVDSEHSAIFQAMQSGRPQEVQKIVLTGSGGPFREASAEEIRNATLEQALAHPVWSMGPKITIDSATMMNKALEVIEARWLFGVDVSRIKVLIHPESIIHSLVEFRDRSVIAQMGLPDMCLPIQYALTYPERHMGMGESLDLEAMGQLHFEKPRMDVFRALALSYEVAKSGKGYAAVFNAANEAAVEEFLQKNIPFYRIVELIEYCLDQWYEAETDTLKGLLEADQWAREEVRKVVGENVRKVGM